MINNHSQTRAQKRNERLTTTKTYDSEVQTIICTNSLSVQLDRESEGLARRMWDVASHMRQAAVDWIFNPCDLSILQLLAKKKTNKSIIKNKSHLQPRLG